MAKLITLLLTLSIALGLGAADKTTGHSKNRKRNNIAYYTIANAPETMEVSLKRGDSIRFNLEENPTTGYVWEAKYDRRYCKIDLKQRASKAKLAGAPGLVEVKIKLNTSRDTNVELVYRRPFEKGVKPIKTIKCHIVNSRYHGAPDEPRKNGKSDKKKAKPGKNDDKSETQK